MTSFISPEIAPAPPIVVGSDGPLDCRIAFVGEAPGEVECHDMLPFVGPAGQLLNQLARQAGIMRNRCYVTNVVKERPPANDITPFISFTRKGVVTSEKYNLYEKFLFDELSKCSANVVVAVGAVSLWALLKQTAITKRRGSIYWSERLRKKVIPIVHPAASLREYLFRMPTILDLKRALVESDFPELRPTERQVKLRPRFDEVIEYIVACSNLKSVGFDIEVMMPQNEVSCFAIAKSPWDILCVPLVTQGQDYFNPQQECEVWAALAQLLENPYVRKIGQNITFDATFMLVKFGIRCWPVEDTMIGQGILAPDFPKGLDFITSIYTREPYYKDEGKKWMTKLGGSEENFWLYNAKDAAVCMECLTPILSDIEQMGNGDTYRAQRDLVLPLTYMHYRGIRADVEGMKEASRLAESRLRELESALCLEVGFPINARSPKQLMAYFYDTLHIKPYISRATGKPTVDEKALKRIAARSNKAASILLDMRKLDKMKGTYLDMGLDDDNRLRCSFNPVGTKTGRLSSSKTIFDTGGNMQNLPPEFKQFITADPGYVLYNVDLSQAENRLTAYIAPEPTMIAAFEQGKDLHRLTAAAIFGKPPEEISDEEGSCSIAGGSHSERFWGKKANHSFDYDFGYRSFAMLYEMTEAEGKIIYDGFHRLYPGVKQYHEWVRNQLGKDRTLENLFGRKRRFYGRWGDDLFKEAYAFIPQSTVADIINRWGLLHIWNNQGIYAAFELLNQVHDSIVFQVPVSVSWEDQALSLFQLKSSLEQELQWRSLTFHIPADFAIGLNLADTKKFHVSNDFKATGELLRLTYATLGV